MKQSAGRAMRTGGSLASTSFQIFFFRTPISKACRTHACVRPPDKDGHLGYRSLNLTDNKSQSFQNFHPPWETLRVILCQSLFSLVTRIARWAHRKVKTDLSCFIIALITQSVILPNRLSLGAASSFDAPVLLDKVV